jgi:hypothetical protein
MGNFWFYQNFELKNLKLKKKKYSTILEHFEVFWSLILKKIWLTFLNVTSDYTCVENYKLKNKIAKNSLRAKLH